MKMGESEEINVYVCFSVLVSQVYRNTPETINLIIEVFVEVAHKQICYLGEVGGTLTLSLPSIRLSLPSLGL